MGSRAGGSGCRCGWMWLVACEWRCVCHPVFLEPHARTGVCIHSSRLCVCVLSICMCRVRVSVHMSVRGRILVSMLGILFHRSSILFTEAGSLSQTHSRVALLALGIPISALWACHAHLHFHEFLRLSTPVLMHVLPAL